MRLTAMVTVQAPPTTANTTYDSEGISTIIWTASQTTEKGDKQPLSGEVAPYRYGLSESGITNIIFLKSSTTAAEGGRIIHDSETYEIYRLEEFDNHCEALVKPVME